MPPAKNPIDPLSGDQNGSAAPSPLSIRRASDDPSVLTQSWFSVETPVPTMNATIRPFGEMATFVESGLMRNPVGGGTDNRTTSPAETSGPRRDVSDLIAERVKSEGYFARSGLRRRYPQA